MSDLVPRIAPRSIAAAADFELLRVARTDLDEPDVDDTVSLVDRIRGSAAFRALRPPSGGPGAIAHLGRRVG